MPSIHLLDSLDVPKCPPLTGDFLKHRNSFGWMHFLMLPQ